MLIVSIGNKIQAREPLALDAYDATILLASVIFGAAPGYGAWFFDQRRKK